MSGIEIVNGTVETHRYEMEPLLVDNVGETTRTEILPLNPNWDEYVALEKAGFLFSLFVKDNGKLVGYSVNTISDSMQHSGVVIVDNVVTFLDKNYRKGGIGRDLISRSELRAKELGANIFIMHAKDKSRLSKLLPALGYEVEESIHLKVL